MEKRVFLHVLTQELVGKSILDRHRQHDHRKNHNTRPPQPALQGDMDKGSVCVGGDGYPHAVFLLNVLVHKSMQMSRRRSQSKGRVSGGGECPKVMSRYKRDEYVPCVCIKRSHDQVSAFFFLIELYDEAITSFCLNDKKKWVLFCLAIYHREGFTEP